MYATIPILTLGPYPLALAGGLLLYWNASLIVSRVLTAFIVSMIAMKLDLAFHLFLSACHHGIALLCRFQTYWDPNDSLEFLQTQSQFYSIADTVSLALLVGNSVQLWTAALVTRIALSALATRTELSMRWWQSQSAVEHAFLVLGCLLCGGACALQWAYYTLLSPEERADGESGSLLMWYTSIVYIVAVGLRSVCTLATAVMRMWGYGALRSLAGQLDPVAVRALEDSGLNPFSEVHELYMQYLYTVACAATAWLYTSSSTPLWMQCFMLLRIYLITLASEKLRHYQQVLDRFPSVAADPTKTCGICLDDFVEGESVKRLPCGHTFHGTCVRSWLLRSGVCPTCRQPVAPPNQTPRAANAPPGRGQRQPRVSLDMHVPAHGGAFTGSLQPLAPRLPAAAAARPPRHDASSPPSASFSLELLRLPHHEELQRVDARRRSLALHRQQQLSPVVGTRADTAPGPPPPPPPPPQQQQRRAADADRAGQTDTLARLMPAVSRESSLDVDAALFTETPLIPADVAPPATRQPHHHHRRTTTAQRKRPRPPSPQSSAGNTTGDGSGNTVASDVTEPDDGPSRRRTE
ncbi:putative zinc finger protein [Novymonas esmeraldas]|uniref:Zinc finger protein n=1 Tax=Novymonas esmeraldas TaxID=1808958 RepID=A0AAW0ESB4_9TRYP